MILEKLKNIQQELKVNKGQYNNFGGYKYRSCEDILEAVKPLLEKNELVLVLDDDLVQVGERYYVKATATLYETKTKDNENDKVDMISNKAFARESESKKGMDESQVTGTASSYARKYALNGLFAIDDTKDADTDEYQKQINHQDEQKINKTKVEALKKSIENNKLAEDFVQNALNNNGFEKIEDITNNKYLDVVNELRKGAE